MAVKFLSKIRFAYLAYFSHPTSDRKLFRVLRKRPVRSIVELGLGDGQRTLRLLEGIRLSTPSAEIRYAAVDLFEARTTAGLSLKRAHQLLSPLVQQLRLLPGDPFTVLSRSANSLLGTDLLLIHCDQDSKSLENSWMFVPRMLRSESLIFVEQPASGKAPASYQQLTLADVEQLAANCRRQSRRVA